MRAIDIMMSLFCAGLAALLASEPALPQMQRMGDASMHTERQPYGIETFGVFRNMMMTGDFSAKVRLSDVMAKHPSTGVGALVDARGEITIYDGKLIVSYGRTGTPADKTSADKTSESAALLAIGSVAAWQSVPIEHDVGPEEIESYIAAAAKSRGVDPDVSFPFAVRGSIGPYAMHVNAAPTDGPHGMGLPMAVRVESEGDRLDGLVAGLYVTLDLMGVATHGGERTHAHWVSPDMASTAHLDKWGVKAGSVLLLPKAQ